MLHHGDLERLLSSIQTQLNKSQLSNAPFALLTDDLLRRPIRRCLERSLPDVAVIAFGEIPSDMMIEQVAVLESTHVFRDSNAEPVSPFAPPADSGPEIHAVTQGAA